MKKNEYKQRTPRLGIPVVGHKDPIWPDLELKKWTIVENMLMVATRGLYHCIFQEGGYSVVKKEGEVPHVLLRAMGSVPCLQGIVNGIFFFAASQLKWTDLTPNRKNYLYVASTRKTYVKSGDVRVFSSTHQLTPRRGMLVAVIDLKGDQKLDIKPEGKQYSDSFSAPSKMLAPKVVEFETGGPQGVLLTVGGNPVGAIVNRLHGGSEGSHGDVSYGYYGRDDQVDRGDKLMVYNTGEVGITMRAVIFCE